MLEKEKGNRAPGSREIRSPPHEGRTVTEEGAELPSGKRTATIRGAARESMPRSTRSRQNGERDGLWERKKWRLAARNPEEEKENPLGPGATDGMIGLARTAFLNQQQSNQRRLGSGGWPNPSAGRGAKHHVPLGRKRPSDQQQNRERET